MPKDLIEWVGRKGETIIPHWHVWQLKGKLISSIFGAIAEFERKLITERTRAGLAAVRTPGRLGGRPKKID